MNDLQSYRRLGDEKMVDRRAADLEIKNMEMTQRKLMRRGVSVG